MKKRYLYVLCLLMVVSGVSFVACSEDDEDDSESFDMSKLVGSEWKRTYSYFNTDDASGEEGECLLTFTSSTQAQEYISYHGKEWSGEDGDRYQSYSGSTTIFYTYQVTGTKISLQGEEEYDEPTYAVVSGNKMVASNDLEWTLVKAGTGNVEEPLSSYTWENMQGAWMQSELYGMYASALETYKNQNVSSEVLLNNSYDGDFGVSGYQFSASGGIKNLYVCTKIWHNENALILKIMNTSDRKTVYWTDIEHDTFTDKMTIRDDKIYHNGKVRFEILSSKIIMETSTETMYEKVK